MFGIFKIKTDAEIAAERGTTKKAPSKKKADPKKTKSTRKISMFIALVSDISLEMDDVIDDMTTAQKRTVIRKLKKYIEELE